MCCQSAFWICSVYLHMFAFHVTVWRFFARTLANFLYLLYLRFAPSLIPLFIVFRFLSNFSLVHTHTHMIRSFIFQFIVHMFSLFHRLLPFPSSSPWSVANTKSLCIRYISFKQFMRNTLFTHTQHFSVFGVSLSLHGAQCSCSTQCMFFWIVCYQCDVYKFIGIR